MRGTTIELLWSHGIVCPLVRRSSRCAWGFYVAWTAGLHHKALFPHSTPERQSLFESHRQRRWLTHWSYRGQSPAVKEQIVDMAMHGSGIRDTARVLHVSTNMVMTEL